MSWTSTIARGFFPSAFHLFAQIKSTAATETKTEAPKKVEVDITKTPAYEAAKKICRNTTMGSKLVYYTNCLAEAKRRLKDPPKPAKPRTPLERELASCEMRGKPVQVWQCKREAPAKVERVRKDAAEAALRDKQTTPLEKALSRCTMFGKGPQIMQCRLDAKKRYGTK